MENLPALFRQDPKLHGHLNYIPQIAAALDVNKEAISSKEDYKLARQSFEKNFKQGGEEELRSIIFSGLLVELDETEARKLLESEFWHKARWPEALKLVQEAKDGEQGYVLARYLPPLKKMIEFRRKYKIEN